MEPGEFPPNSKKAKEAAAPVVKPPVEQIITGGIIRKKPLGRRFKDVFLGGDFKRARDYVLGDVAIPMIRDMVWAVISKGSERIIYPETRRQAARPSGLFAPRIQYNSPVRRDPRELEMPGRPGPQQRSDPRNTHDTGEIIVGTREDAQLLLEQLIEYVESYGQASVGDLYALLGYEATFVNEQWGWTNLAAAEIKQVSRGYLVELPDPEPITRA